MVLAWSDEFNLGIDELDRQHQELFALFNSLHAAVQEGKVQEFLDTAVAALLDYTVYHFSFEEMLMRDIGYADEAAHTAEHLYLTTQVQEIAAKLRAGGSEGMAAATVELLAQWLVQHICVRDRQLAPSLQAEAAGSVPDGAAAMPEAG